MTARGDAVDNQAPAVTDWDPRRYLRRVDGNVARLSRGFLRCRPEKWFPGFAGQWLPFVHSLGVDVKVLEVKTALSAPKGLEYGFTGTVDDEPISIMMDPESTKIVLEAVVPGGFENARATMLEYLARRYLASLTQAWSGPESSVVRFDASLNQFETAEAGAIRHSFAINGQQCSVWIVLGRTLVERLDGLWRRQVRSTVRQSSEASQLRIEATHLMVPPALLSEYMKPGTVVDLETVISDQVILRVNDRSWLPARLCEIDGNLGFEVTSGVAPTTAQPEGTTRLGIEFGSLVLDSGMLAEVGQIGACYQTDLPISNRVDLLINGERAAQATLCTYEGRFAITVA